ncbi:hypothetical protein [Agromyces albus]|jgi:hypothetical protein|uniref:hypothetical protein n=1 Tax=Agromyces albus TaxID=205332 RepID=UPI0027D8E741|nr:hypothetical protein [Agromyces albus]
MDTWAEFSVIMGGAAAALVGLLFVAVSIRADFVSRSGAVRSRLAQTLTIFLGLLASSILLAVPNPARWMLGVELFAVSMLMTTAHVILNRRAQSGADRRRLGPILDRVNPNITTAVLIGLCGLVLVFGLEAGLFLLAAAALVGFVGGAVSAWLVLVLPED